MPECTGCEMSFDEKEYINCPYCGLSPENAVEKDNASATMTQPDRKRVKLLIVSLVVFAVIAVLALMTFMPGDDAISVPDDFPTIQAAIDAAVDGDELVVQLGVYRETIDFNGKNIILRSTNPDDPDVVAQTIINAEGNRAVVSFRSGENEGAVLSGFTIMRGSGSGIIVSGGSSPTIEKNIIEDNTAEDGGGIVIYDSSPFIRGNTITGNSAFIGGGIHMDNSSPVIEGNVIIENRAEMGGGIAININSLPIITGNTVSQNRAARIGGGIVVAGGSAPSIRENTIAGNAAGRNGGGLLIEESEPVVDGNTIAHNMAANGGGIFIALSLNRPLMIINNMINGNRALNDGGGFFMSDSSLTIEGNSIIDNIAESSGGGMAVFNSSPRITANIFENNRAGAQAGGGAIWISADSVLELNDPDDNTYLLNTPGNFHHE